MNTQFIEQQYQKAKNTPSDINEHIEVLYNYALKCDHVTELGVRSVVATWAFLKGAKKYVGYDMFEHPNMKLIPHEKGSVIIADVLNVEIEPTDFLFIDTFHTYSQLKKELELHADKAKKYIGFHDTTTFANIGETPYEGMGGKGVDCGKGLWPAITEFLMSHREWALLYKTDKNNGLTILEKK